LSSYSLVGEHIHDPSYVPHWSDHLIALINTADFLSYQQEEGVISAGESRELEAISAVGDSPGSSTTFEDASEEVLAEGTEGAWGGSGVGVPDDVG